MGHCVEIESVRNEIGANLRQGKKNESPFPHAGMRQDESLIDERKVIVVEQVKVDGSRSIPFPFGGPTECPLDFLGLSEEIKWGESGLYFDDGVVERFGSGGAVDRFGLIDGRDEKMR